MIAVRIRSLSLTCFSYSQSMTWFPTFVFAVLFLLLPSLSDASEKRPNFIIALADDLGYGDLACYGHPHIRTPHLDRFAREGVKFTHCYAASANCSPARTGLMTGRTPWRVGVHNWIPMLSPMHVPETEITIATLLRDSGYATCHSGKWHLNGMFNLPGQPQPDDHGFDHWFSVQNNGLPNHRNPYNFVRNGIPVGPLEGYSAELVADEAIDWLRNGRKLDQPFFLFVCFHEPHEPIASAPRFTRQYEQFEDLSQRAHYGNVTQLDSEFGRLLAEVDSQGLTDNTLVLFTSDNGPAITGKHPYGSAGNLRAKKGWLWEGGIRVPGIARWPGKIDADTVSAEPVSGVDLLPTLCELAGVEVPQDRALDGTSIKPLFDGEMLARHTPLYWHFLRAKGPVKVAMRDGDWKMVAGIEGEDLKPAVDITAEEIEFYKTAELTHFELYHLSEDEAETTDRSRDEPARFEEMKSALLQKYHEVREESPSWPEWEWPRYEGQRIEWPDYKPLRKPPVYK